MRNSHNAVKRGLASADEQLPTVQPAAQDFFRATVTLPVTLHNFIKQRTAQAHYAGNMSAYLRDLVIADQEAFFRKIKRARKGTK